jgi:hypothetical protein
MTGMSLYGRMSFYMLYVLSRIMVSICQVISLYISDHYMSIASYHYVNTNRCSYQFLSLIVVISLLELLDCGVPALMELFLWLTCCGRDLPRNGLPGSCWGKASDPFLVGVGVHPCMEIGPC